MKKSISIILYIITVFSLYSCSSSDSDAEYVDMTELDLGEGVYRPNPFRILDSIPPFSWMGMPDSVRTVTELKIQFNEDAVRSKSRARVLFLDYNGNNISGFEINGIKKNSFESEASENESMVEINYTVNPSVGDSLLSGIIAVSGNDLDQVNAIGIDSGIRPIAIWKFNHKTGINWLRWTILISGSLIILFLIYCIICLLFGAGSAIAEAAPGFISSISFPSFSLNRGKTKRKKTKKSTKKEDKVNNRTLRRLLQLESKLYESGSTPDKYDTLETIRNTIDGLYEKDRNTYNHVRVKLKSNTWEALEEAWKLWNPTPTTDVEWCGLSKQRCVLQPTHALYADCKKLSFTNCNYDEHGSPDFSEVTCHNSIVDISDLYDELSCEEIDKRGGSKSSLQEIAQRRMAKQLEKEVNQWAKVNKCSPDFYKWRDAHNLVPHEDTNCRTMRLVNRTAHMAFKHRGGVANAINIKKHFPCS